MSYNEAFMQQLDGLSLLEYRSHPSSLGKAAHSVALCGADAFELIQGRLGQQEARFLVKFSASIVGSTIWRHPVKQLDCSLVHDLQAIKRFSFIYWCGELYLWCNTFRSMHLFKHISDFPDWFKVRYAIPNISNGIQALNYSSNPGLIPIVGCCRIFVSGEYLWDQRFPRKI